MATTQSRLARRPRLRRRTAPSALGFIGELFPLHEWQNRKAGDPNDQFNFHDSEMLAVDRVKKDLLAGKAVDWNWSMDLMPPVRPGLPRSFRLTYFFGTERPYDQIFNNVPYEK
jgi:hypothetical protein